MKRSTEQKHADLDEAAAFERGRRVGRDQIVEYLRESAGKPNGDLDAIICAAAQGLADFFADDKHVLRPFDIGAAIDAHVARRRAAPSPVEHAKLTRSGDSPFRSCCPVCDSEVVDATRRLGTYLRKGDRVRLRATALAEHLVALGFGPDTVDAVRGKVGVLENVADGLAFVRFEGEMLNGAPVAAIEKVEDGS